MKTNRLSVQILKPVNDVFTFTTNPQNTPKWLATVTASESSDWPIKLGSTYKNQHNDGSITEFDVTNLVENQKFELTSKDGRYHVRFGYKPLSGYKSELEFFEWHDDEDLANPLRLEALNKLKRLIEGV